jgi:GNAT superfamily N-acetyltransferase
VSNLYVKESERGGTGTRLLEAALAWARANGFDRAVLWPTRRSVTLYLRHGFTHGGDVMELKL